LLLYQIARRGVNDKNPALSGKYLDISRGWGPHLLSKNTLVPDGHDNLIILVCGELKTGFQSD
jgi:hypothetical protein